MRFLRIVPLTMILLFFLLVFSGCKKKQVFPHQQDSFDKTMAIALIGESDFRGIIVNSDMKMDSIAIIVSANGMTLPGFMSVSELVSTKYESISEDSVYYTFLQDSSYQNSNLMGRKTDSTGISPLVGQRVLKVKGEDGNWAFVIPEHFTPEQVSAITKEGAKESDSRKLAELMYPKEKIKIGHCWSFDAALFSGYFGEGMSGGDGKGSMTFKDIISYNGDNCALLEGDFVITGLNVKGLSMGVNVKMKILRSLTQFTDLKVEMIGEVSGSLHQTSERTGKSVNISMNGPIKAVLNSILL